MYFLRPFWNHWWSFAIWLALSSTVSWRIALLLSLNRISFSFAYEMRCQSVSGSAVLTNQHCIYKILVLTKILYLGDFQADVLKWPFMTSFCAIVIWNHSLDLENTHMISEKIALHSVQLPLYIGHKFLFINLENPSCRYGW